MGLTTHGVKTSSNINEKWRSMRKRAAEKRANRSCTVGTVLKASRLFAGRLHPPCRSRRQLPPTRRSPSRASQRLTMCQFSLSTPCIWNQAFRHNFLAGCIVNFMRTSGTPCRYMQCCKSPEERTSPELPTFSCSKFAEYPSGSSRVPNSVCRRQSVRPVTVGTKRWTRVDGPTFSLSEKMSDNRFSLGRVSDRVRLCFGVAILGHCVAFLILDPSITLKCHFQHQHLPGQHWYLDRASRCHHRHKGGHFFLSINSIPAVQGAGGIRIQKKMPREPFQSCAMQDFPQKEPM